MRYFEHYEQPLWTGQTFAERTGKPEEITCAIGRIAMNFARLEHVVAECASKLLKVEEATAQVLLAEHSFKGKVGVLSSLFRIHAKGQSPTIGGYDRLEIFEELCSYIFRSEELRNMVLHSNWNGPYLWDRVVTRRKVTAKASHGLRIQEETMDAGKLLDIADYIGGTAEELDNYFPLLTFDAGDSEELREKISKGEAEHFKYEVEYSLTKPDPVLKRRDESARATKA